MGEVPRDLTIWKAVSEPSGNLASELLHSFTVFRWGQPVGELLSMVGKSLLRSSFGSWTSTVLTVHQWSDFSGTAIQHFVMLPESPEPVSIDNTLSLLLR